MAYWQKAPCQREQLVLFAPTLEDRIREDHPVRLLDEILAGVDWSDWEAEYDGQRGQPPIHPRVLAGTILYGLTHGVRSSRKLEYHVSHSIDFIWLVEGRSLDHTTICEFRTKFKQPLKTLYRQICRVAMAMGVLRLCDVAIDGTRVRASNGRNKTLTAAQIESLLNDLDQRLEQLLNEADAEDANNGDADPEDKLPDDVATMKCRREKLAGMLEQAQAADKSRKREGIDPTKNPAQIPVSDPGSRVLPNKEGGYAPNYTPMAATDVDSGFIVAADVLPTTSEQSVAGAMMDDIHQTLGESPTRLLGDGIYATGETLQEVEDKRGIELLSPAGKKLGSDENPAIRDDPREPVPEAAWDKLPISPQTKKLDKSAFVYVEDENCYYCPDGRPLPYEQNKSERRRGQWISRDVFRSPDCDGCPLRALCHSDTATKNRSVSRDVHESRRQAHAKKMATPEATARYQKRFHSAEVPFAILKHVMNLRRFLLRGLEKVKTEWLWACTAYNMAKLMRAVVRLRAEFATLAASVVQ